MNTDGVRTAVIGAGTMGAGIAQCLADHGLEVKLYDVSSDAPNQSVDRMDASRQFLVEAGLLSEQAADRGRRLIQATTSLQRAASDIDLLIEAVPEDLSLKCDVFRELDRLCDMHVSFASNTSGLSITRLALAGASSGISLVEPGPVGAACRSRVRCKNQPEAD